MENIENNRGKQEGTGKKATQFKPGKSGNPNGRPKQTKEQKEIKKATKELIGDYKEKLAEALPKISPVLIKKAIAGNILAIKEIHDRVMGKSVSPIDITSGGEPLFQPTLEERAKIKKAFKEIE